MQSASPESSGPVRRVADVDLSGVADALDDASLETDWWYDPATGQVEMRLSYAAGLDVDDDDDPFDRGLVRIEAVGSHEAYQDMVEFAEAVADPHASDLLLRALEGRGAFRRFRDTLYDFPTLSVNWHAYRSAGSDRRAIEWLTDGHHVDPADAATERARLIAAMTQVLTEVGSADSAEIADTDVGRRWDQLREMIDAGRSVTVLRDGEPWAMISPHPPQRRP